MTTCKTGKVCLDSWKLAQHVRGRHIRDDAGCCQAHKCEHCGKWHVGRRLVKEKRRPRVEMAEEEV